MKRLLIFIGMFICVVCQADTINLHWKNYDGSSYAESTCTVDGDLNIPTTTPTRYGYTFTGWKFANYQPIEYLESTGTQWIDTGFMPDQDSGMEIDFRLSLSDASTSYRVAVVADGDNRFGIHYSKLRDRFYSYAGTTSNSWTINNIYTQNPTDKYYFSINKTNAELKTSTGITQTHTFPNTTYAVTVPLYLFALNRDGVIEQTPLNLQIYACKLYDNGTLVRDFIPVLDFNNVPCMYDKVTKQFFYNQGTGDFIAGPVISGD